MSVALLLVLALFDPSIARSWIDLLLALVSLIVVMATATAAWFKVVRPLRFGLLNLYTISAALTPNGGSSLYDRMSSIDRRSAVGEARLAGLVELSGFAEVETDGDGKVVRVSEAACDIVDRSAEDFLGLEWKNVLHADDRARVLAEWLDAVRDRRTYRARMRWTRRDGEAVPIDVIARPVIAVGLDKDKKPADVLVGYIATVRRSNHAAPPFLSGARP